LAYCALEEAKRQGAVTEKIIISDYRLGPCLVHDNCSKVEHCAYQDDGLWILKRFSEADGVVLATPVYYYDVSCWMKIFIDRNWFLYAHGQKCKAKAVGIIVVAGESGIEDTVSVLNRYVNSSTFNRLREDSKRVVSGIASARVMLRETVRWLRKQGSWAGGW